MDCQFGQDYDITLDLDHGNISSLYFVDKEYKDFKLIHITYGLLSPKDLYRFGKIIQKVVLESEEKVVLIASGDLSTNYPMKALILIRLMGNNTIIK